MTAPSTTPNKAQGLTAQIDQFVKDLATATDAAKITDAMTAYLNTCARFYHYSEGNQILIAWQMPDAENVAGYNTWLKLKRYVKRGEKGIMILCPCPFQKDDPSSPDGKRSGIYFKAGYVFDVSQTDGEPLPPAPTWKSPEQNPELFARLVEFAAANNITVEVKDLEGETQGYSAGGKIVLSTQAGTKTLMHELAHELLHHGKDKHTFTAELRELQAESIAYTVARAAGLVELASPNYLALWGATAEIIKANLAVIRDTAAQIISAIMPQAEPSSEPA